MEVHSHTHTPRKKWTHYFWEFFMLFLAVTLGFFVENRREHYIEHQREKQYIRSFVEDLKADTLVLNRTIDWGLMKCAGIDSFMAQAVNGLDAPSLQDQDKQRRLGIYINSPLEFHNNDGTLQQLKNAGGLRLIERQIVSDSIIFYDNRMKYADEQKNKMIAIQSKFLQVAVEIFNLNNIIGDEYLNRKLIPYSPSFAYLSKDPSKWGQLINWLILYKIETLTYVGMLDNLRVLAGRQIKFLRKEYRLK